MDTEKLYYQDCHLSEFDAQVQSCTQKDAHWEVVLDQTAFYPEGGGQASDVGMLGGVRVLDVQEQAQQVVHFCDAPLEPGTCVHGSIDYAHRFDLMQQHTGEHIISGLIHAGYGCHNTGFHMGSDVITIDFDGEVPASDLGELERQANEAVWRNIPLKIWVPSPEQLPDVTYRTKRALPWPVRIVQIPGYDSCACCGVHVAATGEVGLIKLLSCVRFRSGVRIEMLCGARALAHLSRAYEQNLMVSRAFSAKWMETGAAAQKMNETLDDLKYRLEGLRQQTFRQTAQTCRDLGNVLVFAEDLDPSGVRKYADLIADVCGGIAAVVSGSDAEGYSYCLVSRSTDLREIGKELNRALSGRGGGKPEFQQGSLRASRRELCGYFSDFAIRG